MAYNPDDLGRWVDTTSAINVIPNKWGLYEQMGIFEDEPLSGKMVMIPRIKYDESLVPDRAWGTRATNTAGQERSTLNIKVPHFPLDDFILPSDIQGHVSWEDLFSGVEVESLEATRMRKIEQLRRNHALTLEAARAQLINDGTVYAPSGTLATSYGSTYNIFTEHGVGQETKNLDLADTSVPNAGIEPIISHIQDNIGNGSVVDGFVCVCSPELFTALVSHPLIQEAYTYESRKEARDIITGRLTADRFGLDARYRTFYYGGIVFIENRGSYVDNEGNTTKYITTGQGRAFPLTDEAFFKTFYAPADKFGYVNQVAQKMYLWEYPSAKADKIDIESEQNFLNWCLYPQTIVKVTFSTN
jgi:hypothetical protein